MLQKEDCKLVQLLLKNGFTLVRWEEIRSASDQIQASGMQDVLKFYKITSAEILKRRRALYLFISERGGEVTCSTTEKIRQLKAAVLCMFANSPSRGMWRPSTNRETARQTKQWWGHHKYPRYMYPRVHNMEGPPSLLYTLDVVTSNIHQFSFLRYSNFFFTWVSGMAS